MKSKLILLFVSTGIVMASPSFSQQVIPATGGSADGTGGSVSYTLGQIAFSAVTGTNGFIIQGIQQPFEISSLTAIENTEEITLGYSVFPNPSEGIITLFVMSFSQAGFIYQIYNLKGDIIQENKISDARTEISLADQPSAIYFLRVIRENREVKVFKIVKR